MLKETCHVSREVQTPATAFHAAALFTSARLTGMSTETGAKDDALPPTVADGSGSAYKFTPIDGGKQSFPTLQTEEAKEALLRWNLKPFMQAKAFRFDQAYVPERVDAFMRDFFASPEVQAAAPVCTGPGQHTTYHTGEFGPLGDVPTGSVKCRRLPTTVLRLDFFDRLKDEGIVRHYGDNQTDIAKCLDVMCNGILVSDRLRKMLLDESSDEWCVYTEAERAELIFHVMKRLAVGGGMNQWDDSMDLYLSLTKQLYKGAQACGTRRSPVCTRLCTCLHHPPHHAPHPRAAEPSFSFHYAAAFADLVTVSKTAAGSLQVSSHTYEVESVTGSSASLFPRQNAHNFCYVAVDPLAKIVKVWYCAWFPMM